MDTTLRFSLVLLLTALLACGSDVAHRGTDDEAQATVDASATDGSRASFADAANQGAASPDAFVPPGDATPRDAGSDAQSGASNVSERKACIAYATAWCERIARCSVLGGYDQCVDRAFERCPDWFFSEGATNEPGALIDCAPSWGQVTCDELGGGITPPCARAGTRAVGESCLYASQCASAACSGRSDSCGVCQEPVPEGGSCSSVKTCAAGHQCSASKTCVPSSMGGMELGFLGDPCAPEAYSCVYGTMCVADGSAPMGGRCAKRGAGSSCGGDSCAGDAYCDGPSSTCQPLPVEGQACASGEGTFDQDCARGLHCSSRLCTKGLALGEDCHLNFGECGEGMYCVAKPAPSQMGQCMRQREEGESCTDPLHFCIVGTSCTQGTCTSSEQGAFAKACR